MKILYCVPALYNPGGMERILIEKANYLSELEGYEVHIITTDQQGKGMFFKTSPTINFTHLDLDFNQYFNHSIFSKYIGIKLLLAKYRKILENYIVKHNIDILISLGGKELEFLHQMDVPCKKICELHFAINIRAQFLQARGNSFLHRILGKFRTQQLIHQTKKLDQLVVLTKSDAEKLKGTHDNVSQIYNFSPFEIESKDRTEKKIMVAVGKLDPQKGFDLLIEACSKIENWEKWQLHIYGQGPDQDILREQIKSLNLEKYVILKGTTSEVKKVYKNADFYVLSSRYEGFPMVLVEAISLGLPIVSFDCDSGPNEIITDNDCGLLIKDGNTDELAIGIKRLMTDVDLRDRMVLNANCVAQKFTKTEIMKQWITLFSKMK